MEVQQTLDFIVDKISSSIIFKRKVNFFSAKISGKKIAISSMVTNLFEQKLVHENQDYYDLFLEKVKGQRFFYDLNIEKNVIEFFSFVHLETVEDDATRLKGKLIYFKSKKDFFTSEVLDFNNVIANPRLLQQELKELDRKLVTGYFFRIDLKDNYFNYQYTRIFYLVALVVFPNFFVKALWFKNSLYFVFNNKIDFTSNINLFYKYLNQLGFKNLFEFNVMHGAFNNYNLLESMRYRFFKEMFLIDSGKDFLPKKEINVQLNEYLNDIDDVIIDINNLSLIEKRYQSNKTEILELSLDLNTSTQKLLFNVDQSLSYSIFLEMIMRANKIKSQNNNLNLIVINLPFDFYVFINSNLFLQKSLMLNLNANLSITKKMFFSNSFYNLIVKNNNLSKNISLEYQENDLLSESFERFNFKHIVIRKNLITKRNEDFTINNNLKILDAKVAILNKLLLVL